MNIYGSTALTFWTVACCLALTLATSTATATHSRYESDFDAGDTVGWSPDRTSPVSPLFPTAGRYLGPFANETVSLFIMDALPAYNELTDDIDSTPRIVRLGFDLVLPHPHEVLSDTFTVTANGSVVLEEILEALPSRPLVSFLLEPGDGDFGFTDLVLGFSKDGSPTGLWGLGNVVFDWGRPVPEPPAGSLVLILCAAAALPLLLRRLRFTGCRMGRTQPMGCESFSVSIVAAALLVLSSSATAQVHNIRIERTPVPRSVLTNHVTNDILIDFSGRYNGSQMVIELTQGSIYQDPVGSVTPPIAALLPLFPTLEYDTFVAQGSATAGGPHGNPSPGSGAVNLGGEGMATFDESRINQAWHAVPGSTPLTDQEDFLVARVTLSSDAAGRFAYFASAGTGAVGEFFEIEFGILRGCLGFGCDDDPAFLFGDYNGSGRVEQGDLDLVLLNWGAPAEPPPEGWRQFFPTGTIDQNELDEVLLNWGRTAGSFSLAHAAPVAGPVPEPSTLAMIALCVLAAILGRRLFARNRASREKKGAGPMPLRFFAVSGNHGCFSRGFVGCSYATRYRP